MAKSIGGVRTAEAQFPKGISWAPVNLDDAIRGFANQNWRDKARRAASPRERKLYYDMADGATSFLREENPLLVRILSAGQTATREGASDRQLSDFAKLAKQGGLRMIEMSKDAFRTTNERNGLLILGTRIANAANPSILP